MNNDVNIRVGENFSSHAAGVKSDHWTAVLVSAHVPDRDKAVQQGGPLGGGAPTHTTLTVLNGAKFGRSASRA